MRLTTTLAVIGLLIGSGAGAVPADPPEASGPVSAQQRQAEVPEAERVDINKASFEELQEVPGIGPTVARRIVEFRKEHGAFRRIDDLLDVQGIGTRSLERLRPYLKIEPVQRPKGERGV